MAITLTLLSTGELKQVTWFNHNYVLFSDETSCFRHKIKEFYGCFAEYFLNKIEELQKLYNTNTDTQMSILNKTPLVVDIPLTTKQVGSAGGKARAAKLTKDEKIEIARKAAVARWGNRKEKVSKLTKNQIIKGVNTSE